MLQIFEVRYNIGRYIYWILVVQGDWNAKVGRDVCRNWQDICGPFCNDDTNERGLRLLEFATFNDLVVVQRCMKKENENWIGEQCSAIGEN